MMFGAKRAMLKTVMNFPEPIVKARRPWVIMIATVFLGYTSLVALPLILLATQRVDPWATFQVALGFVAAVALLVFGRWRVTFHLTRLALAFWAGRGVFATFRLLFGPAAPGVDGSRLLIQQSVLLMGVGGLCLLFYLYSFGQASRRFYGLRAFRR